MTKDFALAMFRVVLLLLAGVGLSAKTEQAIEFLAKKDEPLTDGQGEDKPGPDP